MSENCVQMYGFIVINTCVARPDDGEKTLR